MHGTHHFRVIGVDCAILFFVASLLFFFGAASRTGQKEKTHSRVWTL